MKTAMQEAFEHQKLWIESGFTLDKWFEHYEQIHLKKEKNQVMDAHYFGYTDCRSHNMRTEEQYYNEIFKSE